MAGYNIDEINTTNIQPIDFSRVDGYEWLLMFSEFQIDLLLSSRSNERQIHLALEEIAAPHGPIIPVLSIPILNQLSREERIDFFIGYSGIIADMMKRPLKETDLTAASKNLVGNAKFGNLGLIEVGSILSVASLPWVKSVGMELIGMLMELALATAYKILQRKAKEVTTSSRSSSDKYPNLVDFIMVMIQLGKQLRDAFNMAKVRMASTRLEPVGLSQQLKGDAAKFSSYMDEALTNGDPTASEVIRTQPQSMIDMPETGFLPFLLKGAKVLKRGVQIGKKIAGAIKTRKAAKSATKPISPSDQSPDQSIESTVSSAPGTGVLSNSKTSLVQTNADGRRDANLSAAASIKNDINPGNARTLSYLLAASKELARRV